MTDQEINQAIAEACGWVKLTDEDSGFAFGLRWKDSNGEDHCYKPSYTTDLNAMHEAEKTLGTIDSSKYCEILNQVSYKTLDKDYKLSEWYRGKFVCAHATARQRAEAFLRTLGKWKNQHDK